ncbi:MAG: hypothetical protein K8U57_03340 [Planctomycetes bacterium]|nr:hypothetical protein [Planctomycetota bacterium]
MIRPMIVLVAIALPTIAADEPKLPGPKIAWPEVKGLTFEKAHVYPEAALGYSVAYTTPGLTISVYVYDKGLAAIPTGAKSDIVRDEMKQVVADIEELKKRGQYTSVKEVGKEETIRLGEGKNAPTALRRKFEIARPKEAEARFSEAYITGYKDHFFKIRVTYVKDGAEKSEKLIQSLLEALGPQLK